MYTPGDELTPLRVTFTRTDLMRYAGASGDYNPIHYDDTAARSAGLATTVVQGMLNMGAMGRLLEPLLQAGYRLDEWSTRFRSFVYPGQTVEATGVVTMDAGHALQVKMALTVVGQDKPALVGNARMSRTDHTPRPNPATRQDRSASVP